MLLCLYSSQNEGDHQTATIGSGSDDLDATDVNQQEAALNLSTTPNKTDDDEDQDNISGIDDDDETDDEDDRFPQNFTLINNPSFKVVE